MPIPQDRSPDSTLAFLGSDAYDFISRRCRKYGTDLFATRLMLRKAFCMMGAEAAAQFYRPGRFTRKRALPLFALTLIQDLGSVMLQDAEEHRRRKAMFLSLMSQAELGRLSELMALHWRSAMHNWQKRREINLFNEAHLPLCAAICEWSGLTLADYEIAARAREFKAMVNGAGAVGPVNWRGHLMRARSERWMREVVRRIRAGRLQVPPGTAAEIICSYRTQSGELLDVKTAAVELINILRPTVANARYVVFSAMALDAYPEWRVRLQASDDDLDIFADEVRRFFPFIPFIGGRVLEEFTWRDHPFKKDDWVLIDLYGTNHDPRIWGDPETFRPERFREQSFGPFDLISHGAGDRRVTHRCPGEWITIEQIKTIARLLVREMRYEVPPQDLRMKRTRIPALPNSGFRMRKVQAVESQPS